MPYSLELNSASSRIRTRDLVTRISANHLPIQALLEAMIKDALNVQQCYVNRNNFSKLSYLPSEKKSALKGNNLLPVGALTPTGSNFLSFQKGLGMQEGKQEVTKVVSLVKMVKKIPGVNSHISDK